MPLLRALYFAYHFDHERAIPLLGDFSSQTDFRLWLQLAKDRKGFGTVFVLEELIHQMTMNLRGDDLGAFLTRFYRFREVLMHYILQKLNFQDKDETWSMGRAPQVLMQIGNLLMDSEQKTYLGAYFYLKSQQVVQTIDLRNHSILGHGRIGFSHKGLWSRYEGYAQAGGTDQDHIKHFSFDLQLVMADLGHTMGHNPYDFLKDTIVSLLAQTTISSHFALQKPHRNDHPRILLRIYTGLYEYRGMLAVIEQGLLPTSLAGLADVSRRLLMSNISEQDATMLTSFVNRFHGLNKFTLWMKLYQGDQYAVMNLLVAQMRAFSVRNDFGEWLTRAYRLLEEIVWVYFGVDIHQKSLALIRKKSPVGAILHDINTKHQVMLHSLITKLEDQPDHVKKTTAHQLLCENWVQNMIQMRTEGLIGHGLTSITKEYIELHSKPLAQIEESILVIFDALGVPRYPDCFQTLHGLMDDNLE